MKAELSNDKSKFTPVLITLETQEEVDGLYAFLRHTVSTFAGFFSEEYDEVRPFVSNEEKVFDDFHEKVKAWEGRRKP